MKTTVPTKTYNQKQNPMNTNTNPVHQPTMFTSDVAFPQAAGISRKAFIGIDNGFTGGIACLLPDGNVLTRPVSVIDLGKERLLDLDRNREWLRAMIDLADVDRQNILAVFEQCQPNPKFGARNNFTNGKNGEFWRLLLSLEGIPFRPVNPQQWQKWIFRGIRGDDTKAMANLVRLQRFPKLDFTRYNRTQVEGVNDAICIALWASELSACITQTQATASVA